MFLMPVCVCREMMYPTECGINNYEQCGIFSYCVSLWLSGIGVAEGVREVQMFFGRRYQSLWEQGVLMSSTPIQMLETLIKSVCGCTSDQ